VSSFLIPLEWAGDIPFFLIIARDNEVTSIDLDQSGWLETYKELLRGASTWHLASKLDTGIVFSMIVLEGEQPYYVARHFVRAGDKEQAHATAYGIGKKRLDGHVDRLWIFYPTMQVCTGDDVDIFGRAALN
jgi:hypothetical protein